MFNGQIGTIVLKTDDGVVRLLEDNITCSYSVGIRTTEGFHLKYISKELYELLFKELGQQEGINKLG